MSIKLLDEHSNIAWDCDGTLFQGKNSEIFARYILANLDKRHHIITFRDHMWANECIDDVRDLGLLDHHFVSVKACPDNIWIMGRSGSAQDQWNLLNWKGKVAAELGCTVLVDDMAEMVIEGCRTHGISFLDASEPL